MIAFAPYMGRLVNEIIGGTRYGQAADAMYAAMATCGAILAQASSAGSGDTPNELPDTLIQGP